MTVGLGIDTGGTYTDSVLLDRESGNIIAKAKIPTDKSNLIWSIKESIKALGSDARKANFVTLSTTLATNAIVEGKGAEVGAIIATPEPVINWSLPPARLKVVAGGHDVRGVPCAELDTRAIEKAALDFRGRVEAVAVSSYFSVRNPEHEIKAKAILEKILDVPVVCGHEITGTLGFKERTVTAILNARIIPIIKNLLVTVRQVLRELNINVPLMIVKSDGTLMDEKNALLMPIKTVLSGPAASVFGALYLTRQKDAVVVDIGGTTTDVAIVKEGKPVLNEKGTPIRGWHTLVKAMDIDTIGLGGDSYIRCNNDGGFHIGPKRVLPLSSLAQRYPEVNKELKIILNDIKNINHRETYLSEPHDFVYLIKSSAYPLEEKEKTLIEALQQGPIPIRKLGQIMNIHPDLLPLERLEDTGVIGRSGLTPTDVLHATGVLKIGDTAASQLGVRIMAQQLKIDEDELIEKIQKNFINNLTRHILNKVIAVCLNVQKDTGCTICKGLIDQATGNNSMSLMNVSFSLKVPLIGVGAPAGIYMPVTAGYLGANLIIPEHAEVANAVGTVVGNIIEIAKIIIRKLDDMYLMFSPWERRAFNSLQEAKQYSIQLGTTKVKEAIRVDSSSDPEIYINGEEVFCGEFHLTVSAVRKPW